MGNKTTEEIKIQIEHLRDERERIDAALDAAQEALKQAQRREHPMAVALEDQGFRKWKERQRR
jgi:hypothetical protein